MRKMFFSGFFVVIVIIASFYTTISNASSSASLGSNAVFEISTAADLFKIVNHDNVNRNFVLKNNIDLSLDTSWHDYVDDFEKGWMPLDSYTQVNCVFDGGGFTICNLFIDRPDMQSAGLFSRNSIDVKNLNIITKSVGAGMFAIDNSEYAGILASENYGKINNVHVEGSVFADEYAGGLIAENYGDIDNCSFIGRVYGRVAGGLVAANESDSFSNGLVNGDVKGHIAGGLVGMLYNSFGGSITCTSFAMVSVEGISFDATPVRAGSFVGVREIAAAIKNCYSQDDLVAIAYGEPTGVITLSSFETTQKNSFEGFDFDNYWFFTNGEIKQRTIAVSSNSISMSGVEVKIIGDRNYYIKDETAYLSLFKGDKLNIGIKTIIVNGKDAVIDIETGNYIAVADNQINVKVETWYLLKVALAEELSNGEVIMGKDYYTSEEEIVITVKPNNGYKLSELGGTYKGFHIEFANIGNEEYNAKTGADSYGANDVLFINVGFEQTGNNAWIWWLLGSAGLVILLGGTITIVIIIKRKKKKV